MKGLIPLALCLFGAASALSIERRDDYGDDSYGSDKDDDKDYSSSDDKGYGDDNKDYTSYDDNSDYKSYDDSTDSKSYGNDDYKSYDNNDYKSYDPSDYKSYEPSDYKSYGSSDYKSYDPSGYSSYDSSDYSPYDSKYDSNDYKSHDKSNYNSYDNRAYKSSWKPKSKDPHFFQVKVDDTCSEYTGGSDYYPSLDRRQAAAPAPAQGSALPAPNQGATPPPPPPFGTGFGGRPAFAGDGTPYDPNSGFGGFGGSGDICPLRNYALRLDKGDAIVTPYNQYYDPVLPTLFVDDDTQLYTVSKHPLQLYIDGVTGALKYTEVGWLPPNAISTGFFHTGTNPLGKLHPSPSLLTWPSTPGIAFDGDWWLCKIGGTGQWKVYANSQNFASQGVVIDSLECQNETLAAINANPWQKTSYDKGYNSYNSYDNGKGYNSYDTYDGSKPYGIPQDNDNYGHSNYGGSGYSSSDYSR